MSRLAARLSLGATFALAACGTNLMVHRDRVTGTLPGGIEVHLIVEVRPEHGMLQPNFDGPWPEWLSQAAVATLMEPIDLLSSSGGAVAAVFRDDLRVAGGPLGWLAALTPFATLADGMYIATTSPIAITTDQWQDLQHSERWCRVQAAREIWHNTRIIDVVVAHEEH